MPVKITCINRKLHTCTNYLYKKEIIYLSKLPVQKGNFTCTIYLYKKEIIYLYKLPI